MPLNVPDAPARSTLPTEYDIANDLLQSGAVADPGDRAALDKYIDPATGQIRPFETVQSDENFRNALHEYINGCGADMGYAFVQYWEAYTNASKQ